MTDIQRRIARARLLRREGKTYAEIRAVVGDVGDDRLATWLAGIPRPPQTRRGRSSDALRRECRRLRSRGLTYSEIAAATGAKPGSISEWVRDIRPPDPMRAQARRLQALRRSAEVRGAQAARRREFDLKLAASSVGPLNDRELFLIGTALYWAEGSKSKPYQVREQVTFVNSDPTMVVVFLSWLDLLRVPRTDVRFRVAIHETADVDSAERYWAELVGVEPATLCRTTVKRHRPATNRRNVGAEYRGCLVVSVLNSARLYRAVAGSWSGLHAQVARDPRRSVDWGLVPPWLAWSRRGVH